MALTHKNLAIIKSRQRDMSGARKKTQRMLKAKAKAATGSGQRRDHLGRFA